MRTIIKENEYILTKLMNQLEKLDFSNYICSPLVNGGCGIGKSTALISDEIYEIFARKLQKQNPKILFIESRSTTRDQLRDKCTNPNYTILQFDAASRTNFSTYDIIIVDEAHSLFSDSEFAPRATAPLAEWLRKSLCFQIYITASDEEFIAFANKYFSGDKEFQLTFPDLTEAHVRYTAKEMNLSISAKKVNQIIARKEYHFFQEKKRGLFFLLSAKDTVSAYQYYTELGYKCGFYVSQQNSTQIVVKDDELQEDDPEDFYDYSSRTITMDVLDFYKSVEKSRVSAGLGEVRASLLDGHFPSDIDYLFMTAVGQEGLSLFNEKLDFIFIEDTFPLTINQKIFRYRDNVDEVFIHLPQRRLERSLLYTMKKMEELLKAPQEYLEGYYHGAGGAKRTGLARAIWYDLEEKKYKVAENYLAYLITKSETYRKIRDNKNNEDVMREYFGQYADKFVLVDSKEDEKRDILINFFKDKSGILVTDRMKEEWTKELCELGLRNKKEEKDFTFQYVMKIAKELNVCTFTRTTASKKDCAQNSNLELGKKYYRVNFIFNSK